MKEPVASATVVRVSPVSVLVTVTVAPGSPRPPGSRMVPLICAVAAAWAQARVADSSKKSTPREISRNAWRIGPPGRKRVASAGSVRPAGGRIPSRSRRNLLERRARDVRLRQVVGVGQDAVDDEPLVAVRLGTAIEIFLQRRVAAVGNTVAP